MWRCLSMTFLRAMHAGEEFVRAYFDKLFLASLFVYLVEKIPPESVLSDGGWVMVQAGTVMGAIITLTTGSIIRKRNGQNVPPPSDGPDPNV